MRVTTDSDETRATASTLPGFESRLYGACRLNLSLDYGSPRCRDTGPEFLIPAASFQADSRGHKACSAPEAGSGAAPARRSL
jgi:hypothetical protein